MVSNGGVLETRDVGTLSGTVGVVSDATLQGDGTTGSPLGIDLSNPNSWTGTQTFSDVDINGGTVDGTAIGATSESSGRFTTIEGTALPGTSASTEVVVSNGGVLETRTFVSLGSSNDEPFITFGSDGGSLTDNRVLSGGTAISLVNSGADDGTLTINNTGVTSLTGTANQVNVSSSTGSVTLSTPQDIHDDAVPTFDGLTLDNLSGSSASTEVVVSNGGVLETRDAGTLSGTVGVVSDATLQGDGTTGSPLGIDLSNPNSWTGTQTFSDVDINGGTVDGTAIGATSESSGRFTTIEGTALPGTSTSTEVVVSNGGVLETRDAGTLSGTVGVVSDATLQGDGTTGSPLGIDLSNPNSWTGTQTFSDVDINGGTVDGTAIGITSESSGRFTTIEGTALPGTSTSTEVVVSNGGVLETRDAGTLSGTVGVVSDATLQGDGTTGSPLGIDLSNPNSWTGTQTFLNVDINGGTVDGTAIGATSESSGRFTTIEGTALPGTSTSTEVVVSNGGVLETRTFVSLGSSKDEPFITFGSDGGSLTDNRVLSGGTAISLVNSGADDGTLTINNTGVTSLTGTANQVNVSSSTGSVTLSTPQDIHDDAVPTFDGFDA